MSKLSRRQFAGSVGAGLLLSPFLSLFDPPPARAATATKRAKRLLMFCTMGTNPSLWTPTQVSGESITTFSPITAPMGAANVSDSVVLLEGLPSGNPGDNHGAPDGLTGMGFGYYAVNNVSVPLISVEQFISDQLVAQGIKTPIANLLLGADTTNTNGNNGKPMFYRAGNPVLPIASPQSAYNTVFSGALPMGVSPNTVLMRRQSILDNVMAEINTIYANVGSADKAKLDQHLDSIRTLESKLMQSSMSTASASCNMLTPVTDSTSTTPGVADDLLHMEIIVNALACGVTRVAAIEFGTDQSFQVDLPSIQADQHGGMLHAGDPTFAKLIAFETWLATQFAGLITALKARPDPDDPTLHLFDTTLIVWARDMGDAVNHNQNSMRFVLAGGAGGYLKSQPSGRYLNLASMTSNSYNRHERVLLSMCDAFGITNFTGFGDPGLTAKTPLPNVAA